MIEIDSLWDRSNFDDRIAWRSSNRNSSMILNFCFLQEMLTTEISIIVDMSLFQNQLQQRIDKTLNNYVQRHFSQSRFAKLSDFSKSLEQQNQNDENIVDNIKWNSIDLDFFDFFYNDKFLTNETNLIVNIDKNIYFRDVHLFIVRAKKMTLTKDEQLIKDNLWLSLKNTALKW